MRRSVPLLLAFLLLSSVTQARQDLEICGTHAGTREEVLALHQETLRGEPGAPRLASTSQSTNRDFGDLAVIDDSDGVISRFNVFNLNGQTIQFQPADNDSSRYKFTVSQGGYDSDASDAGARLDNLGDDDARLLDLPFPFRFYGTAYQRVYVNSDGNLTFTESDTATSDRSLGRFTAGAPRIAPLFMDLNAAMTAAPNGVRVLADASRVVVSWSNVPEYGSARTNTFQVRLYPDGRIEFSYQAVRSYEAVVGIAPGGLIGETKVVSFSSGSADEFGAAIAELFTLTERVDIVRAAQKFYETHEDAYDYLVIYNNLGIAAAPGAVAFQVPVRNYRTGYGDPLINDGLQYGSASRLQTVLNMGRLDQYPTDPNEVVPARAYARDTPLTILGHEAGHLFLAYVSVREPNDPNARPMLGRQLAHWSFVFNSDASFMEGNRLCDRQVQQCPAALGNGRFVTAGTVEHYAALDQYLMGFRAPEEVPPTFLVENSTISDVGQQPRSGISFDGERRNVQIDELIAVEGRRTPDYTVSQRHFRFAFILVSEAGTDPTADEIAKLDRYRQDFEGFYHQAASQRAWADTALRRELRLSIYPGSGVILGHTAPAAVSIARPAAADLEVLLSSDTGAAGLPASVTIPAGATSAAFQITGLRAGPDSITAEVPGGVFMRADSPLEVLGDPSGLRLTVVSGDKQAAEPVVLRVSDVNNLPYPGVALDVSLIGGGTLAPGDRDTDANGELQLDWTPGPGPANALTARIQETSTSATVTANGMPYLTGASVVNGASFMAPISPGSFATIFGLNLAGGDVQVLVAGRAAWIYYISDRQINFVVPPETPVGDVEVQVVTALGTSTAVTVRVEAVSPAVFRLADGTAAVRLVGDDGMEIYCTGLGAVESGETVLKPQVLVDGTPLEVTFSGLAPGWVGLYQVNVRLPGLAPGLHVLRLVIGGVEAVEVPLRIP